MSGVNHVTATALGGVGSLGRHATLVLRTARPVQGSSSICTLCKAWNRLSTEDRSYGPIQFRGIAPSSLSGHAVLCKKAGVSFAGTASSKHIAWKATGHYPAVSLRLGNLCESAASIANDSCELGAWEDVRQMEKLVAQAEKEFNHLDSSFRDFCLILRSAISMTHQYTPHISQLLLVWSKKGVMRLFGLPANQNCTFIDHSNNLKWGVLPLMLGVGTKCKHPMAQSIPWRICGLWTNAATACPRDDQQRCRTNQEGASGWGLGPSHGSLGLGREVQHL